MGVADDRQSGGHCRSARDVRGRSVLNDFDFYSRFYAASSIPEDTVAQIRHCLREEIDPNADRLVPSDYLPLFWPWLDFADLFDALSREFNAVPDFAGSFNGTLDSLIRLFGLVAKHDALTENDAAAAK